MREEEELATSLLLLAVVAVAVAAAAAAAAAAGKGGGIEVLSRMDLPLSFQTRPSPDPDRTVESVFRYTPRPSDDKMRITCRAENSRMRGSAIDDSMLLTVICELLNKFDIFCLFSGWETVSCGGGFPQYSIASFGGGGGVHYLRRLKAFFFPNHGRKLFFSLQILPKWN